MAYSRPKQIKRLLSEIELLEPRVVHISVDGCEDNSNQIQTNGLVKTLVREWSNTSKHQVTYFFNDSNLGLLKHFKLALKNFFTENRTGIVFEDDIEFDYEFVKYVDSIHNTFIMDHYWSICGHTPLAHHDKSNFKSQKINMVESNVHTVWGWATTRESIFSYLDFLNLSMNEVLSSLETEVPRLSRDPLIRFQLEENWKRKVKRFFSSNKPNWDNLWVLAGWSSGKKSLMPRISLSRENPDQTEGQTHKHESIFQPWEKNLPGDFEVIGIEESFRRGFERNLFKVRGVSRKNAIYSILRLAINFATNVIPLRKNGIKK